MALNFDGEEEIAPGVNAYRFATPEGRRYYERDPAKAMQLGMPPDYLNRSAGAAPVRPDARLASSGPGFATLEELKASTEQRQATQPQAPVAPEAAAQPPVRDPNADFENKLNEAMPLPQRYVRTAKREAGYRPESMKVSGADPNAVAKLSTAYDDLDEQRAQIAQLQLDAAEEQAGNERINARVARMDAEEQAKKQEALVKAKEDAKRRQMAMLDAEEQQAAKRSPDSQRVFKQKGSGSYFLAALMRGLGELGASMSKSGRNGAAEIIDRRIDQDIAEQEAEIASDKDAIAKRKNAYASMLADGLDPEFARDKLKWMQSLQAEAVAREAAAETSSQQAKAYFLKQADERAMANLAFKTSLLDKQNVQIDSKYDRGSAGGLVKNPNYYKELEQAHEGRNILRAENAGTTKSAFETGKKAEAEQLVKESSGTNEGTKAYQSKLQEAGVLKSDETIMQAKRTLARMKENGITEIPTLQTRSGPNRLIRSTADAIAGAGAGSSLMGDTPDEVHARNEFQQMKNAVKNQLFGAAQSLNESADYESSMEDVNTPEGLQEYVDLLEKKNEQIRAGVAAGYNPKDVQRYEQRRQEYQPDVSPLDARRN